ncbi:nuclear transport factor 2 family protein [Paraburkholderia sp. B3]|uniref:nuclear transport factor 2 family protein n=1 Tax=Paraburkholderia sp. B3 TaxID=3134791 RepID=UPI00398285DF
MFYTRHAGRYLLSKAVLVLLVWSAAAAPSFAGPTDDSGFQASLQGNAMSKTTLTGEAADRLAIRELIDAWAHDADRKLPAAQAALFTDDGVVEVYMSEPGKDSKPAQVLHGRKEIETGIGDALKKYAVTMHVNGQSTVQINGDHATNESYTLAHHFWTENGKRMLLVMGIRYYDTIVRKDGHWLFAERKLIIDWTDSRPSTP